MARTISISPTPPAEPRFSVATLEKDHYHWITVDRDRPLIESGEIDWHHLGNTPGAERIKHNAQRDVWRIEHKGRAFFVKVYHPRGLTAKIKVLLRGPTAVREWEVGRFAAAFNVSAAPPVACAWTGKRGTGGPSILITEAIPDAKPLNDYWLDIRGDLHLADALTDALARLIARAHQCGFCHRDMHPGNILIRPQRHGCEAYFVDLHSVRIGRWVSLREVVANIAELNQWFRRNATYSQRLRFLRRYLSYRDQFAQASSYARNWRIDPRQLAADLARQAERHARKLWSKRDRRSDRDSRYFAKIRPARGWRGHVLLQCKHPASAASASLLTYTREQWVDWLSNPTAWVDPNSLSLLGRGRDEGYPTPSIIMLKDSHTATVCKAMLPTNLTPAPVIVKRSLSRNLWKRLLHSFGPSRHQRAWRMANKLLNRDLPAAHPMAVVEKYTLGIIRTDSISLTESIENSVDLEAFLTRHIASLPQAKQRDVKNRLIQSLVKLLRTFHARGFVHRDMKAPNLLITWPVPYDGRPTFTLIDMDGISHRRRASQQHQDRALARLYVSLLHTPGCTRTDALRLLQRYLTRPGQTAHDWRTHWRRIETRVGDKVRLKETRRQWKLDHYGRE